MKSFLTNKGNLENPDTMLQDKGNIALDESVLVKTFNEHYVSIVKKSCGKKPTNYEELNTSALPTQSKTQAYVSSEHVEKLLKIIDQEKSTGIDKIPPKLVQMSAATCT